MSGLEFKGSISIGAAMPLVGPAIAQMVAQLTAQVAGSVAIQTGLTASPPSISAAASAAANLSSALSAAVSAGLSFPSPSFQLAAIATVIAQLNAALAALSTLSGFLGADVLAYAYEGTGSAFGPALTAQIAAGWPDGTPPTANVTGVILAATSGVSATALTGAFGGALA